MTRSIQTSCRIAGSVLIASCSLTPSPASAGVAEQELAWEQRFGPFEDLVRAHAVPAPNDTANTLEALGVQLGIDLAPKSRDGAAKRKLPDGRPTEWSGWHAMAMTRLEDGVAPLPQEVLEWHAANQGTLEQVREVLRTWKPPQWEEDLADGANAPIPNLLGIVNLDKVLVGDALVADSLGDARRANADLEAAWNLATCLLSRADTISTLVALGNARSVAVALRKIAEPSPTWSDRLDAAPFRQALLVSMRGEARLTIGLAEGRWSVEDPDEGAIRRWFHRRVMGLVTSRALRAAFPVAEELSGAPRCDHPVRAVGPPETGWLEGLLPDFGGYLQRVPARADALALHFELTRRVLGIRRAALETGRLPSSLPDGKGATACPSHSWRWRTDGVIGHLEAVRVGSEGVGTWWDDGVTNPLPMEAVVTMK